MLDKIEAQSVQARVYQQLKSALIAGYFEPGQVLVIRELAEQLGTSAMPIRQSVSRLVSEHALEEDLKPRSSVRVPQLSATVFAELRDMRCLVEAEAAALAALNADANAIARLRELNASIHRAVENREVTETIVANCDFHFALYRMAESVTLLRTIESLWLQSGPYFRVLVKRYFADDGKTLGGVNAHDMIIAAIEARDANAAREALRLDIHKAADFFTTIGQGQSDLPSRASKRDLVAALQG